MTYSENLTVDDYHDPQSPQCTGRAETLQTERLEILIDRLTTFIHLFFFLIWNTTKTIRTFNRKTTWTRAPTQLAQRTEVPARGSRFYHALFASFRVPWRVVAVKSRIALRPPDSVSFSSDSGSLSALTFLRRSNRSCFQNVAGARDVTTAALGRLFPDRIINYLLRVVYGNYDSIRYVIVTRKRLNIRGVRFPPPRLDNNTRVPAHTHTHVRIPIVKDVLLLMRSYGSDAFVINSVL